MYLPKWDAPEETEYSSKIIEAEIGNLESKLRKLNKNLDSLSTKGAEVFQSRCRTEFNNINNDFKTIERHLKIHNQQGKYKERIKSIKTIRKKVSQKIHDIETTKALLGFIPLFGKFRKVGNILKQNSDSSNEDSGDEDSGDEDSDDEDSGEDLFL